MITDDTSYTSNFKNYNAYNHKNNINHNTDTTNMIHERMYVSIQYCSDSLPMSNNEDIITDLVTPRLFNKNHKLPKNETDANNKLITWEWEKWITLPIKYSELTPTSTIAFTLYNLDGIPYGGMFYTYIYIYIHQQQQFITFSILTLFFKQYFYIYFIYIFIKYMYIIRNDIEIV